VVQRLAALIEREDDAYVAQCPELDIASQGATIEEASDNLREALELFFETASKDEISRRMKTASPGQQIDLSTHCVPGVFLTCVEVMGG
jgi:predicted RNase H-like HicB family nuclease